MSKRLRTQKSQYLFHATLLFVLAIIHLFEQDYFLASLLFFTAMINLIAFRQLPWRIAPITVIINLFNAVVILSLAYNYWVLHTNGFAVVLLILGISYLLAALRQIYCIAIHRLRKKKR